MIKKKQSIRGALTMNIQIFGTELNAKKEETKEFLRIANRRLSEGVGDRELLLAYRRNLLKRIRLCEGIASDNLYTRTVVISRDKNNRESI